MQEILIIVLVVAISELPSFVWNGLWSLWVYRKKPMERRTWMNSIQPRLPRTIGSAVVVVILIIFLLVDSATTNRIEESRQQRLIDAVAKQTEAVTAQTKAILDFLERTSDERGDNVTGVNK